MSLREKLLEDGFDQLPASTRHFLSAALVGGVVAIGYFACVHEPLSAAETKNTLQDAQITALQNTNQKLSDVVGQVAQTQAVQANTIASIQDTNKTRDETLVRIENKLDKMIDHELRAGRNGR